MNVIAIYLKAMKGIVGISDLGYRESVGGGSRYLRVIFEDHPGAVNLKSVKVYMGGQL